MSQDFIDFFCEKLSVVLTSDTFDCLQIDRILFLSLLLIFSEVRRERLKIFDFAKIDPLKPIYALDEDPIISFDDFIDLSFV